MKVLKVIGFLFFVLFTAQPSRGQADVVIGAAVKGAVDAFLKSSYFQDLLMYTYKQTSVSASKIAQQVLSFIKFTRPELQPDLDNDVVKSYVEEEAKKIWIAKTSVAGTQYDLVIDATSLQGISTGWTITNSLSNGEIMKGQTAGIIGTYDAGKTFIINLIDNVRLPSGITSVTPALAFYRSRNMGNVIFLDSQGSHRLVSSSQNNGTSSIVDRIATDHFISDVVVQLSDILFYVVGPLLTSDVLEINKVYRKRLGSEYLRPMVVVHNFMDYTEKEEVEKHINDDIFAAFPGAQESRSDNSEPNCLYWLSHEGQVQHIVLAKSDTPAGDYYNNCAKTLIKNKLNALTNINAKNPVEDVKTVVENMLPDYFVPPNSTPGQPPNTLYERVVNLAVYLGKYLGKRPASQPSSGGTETDKAFLLEIVENPDDFSKRTLRVKGGLDNAPGKLEYLPIGDQGVPDAAFAPTYDIYENEETGTWQLLMDLPGLQRPPRAYCPTGNNRILRLSGIRAIPSHTTKELKSSENNRKYGGFRMTIALPDWLDCITASSNSVYGEGVYTLSATRRPPDEPEDEL